MSASYMKTKLLLTTGELDVIIGAVDRIKTQREMKKTWEGAQKSGDSEEWTAHAAWHAWQREAKSDTPFEEWLETYLGVDLEDDDAEDEDPQTPAA
jgi:hypothetical protein